MRNAMPDQDMCITLVSTIQHKTPMATVYYTLRSPDRELPVHMSPSGCTSIVPVPEHYVVMTSPTAVLLTVESKGQRCEQSSPLMRSAAFDAYTKSACYRPAYGRLVARLRRQAILCEIMKLPWRRT